MHTQQAAAHRLPFVPAALWIGVVSIPCSVIVLTSAFPSVAVVALVALLAAGSVSGVVAERGRELVDEDGEEVIR